MKFRCILDVEYPNSDCASKFSRCTLEAAESDTRRLLVIRQARTKEPTVKIAPLVAGPGKGAFGRDCLFAFNVNSDACKRGLLKTKHPAAMVLLDGALINL